MQNTLNRLEVLENNPRDGFGLTLGEVSRQWRILLDQRVGPLGLTSSRCWILGALLFEGPLSQVELARYLGVEAPSMVRQIDKLEEEGLVARTVHPADRRVKLVALADGAQDVCKRIHNEMFVFRDEVFADISEEDIKTTHLTLLAMRDKILSMQEA